MGSIFICNIHIPFKVKFQFTTNLLSLLPARKMPRTILSVMVHAATHSCGLTQALLTAHVDRSTALLLFGLASSCLSINPRTTANSYVLNKHSLTNATIQLRSQISTAATFLTIKGQSQASFGHLFSQCINHHSPFYF